MTERIDEVFEPLDNFDFAMALRYMWSGQAARRGAWKKGRHLHYDAKARTFRLVRTSNGLALSLAPIEAVPIEDILAQDWELIV